MDFAIELGWWRIIADLMAGGLRERGFRMEKRFGDLAGEFGFAEAWKREGLKVDLYSNIFDGKFSVVGLWVGADVYPCYMRVEGVVFYQWLEGVVVRGPHPVEKALLSAYGNNFMYPIDKWDRESYMLQAIVGLRKENRRRKQKMGDRKRKQKTRRKRDEKEFLFDIGRIKTLKC